MTNEIKSLIILSYTPYFGSSKFLNALNSNISLGEIISSPEKYSHQLSLRKETIDFLKQEKYLEYLEKVNNWLSKPTNKILSYYDNEYPDNLKQINNPPFILYCSGDISLLKTNQLAIVGARNHSSYGKNVTEELCKELQNSEITITSGLAYGIDTLAHKYALEYQLRTIAVVGSGVDIIYPSSNRALYEKILKTNLIISEFALGTPPLKYNFPQRNRIISGLSKGVIIVEAANRSGSLITAQLALEQNKEVFAIPGNIFSKTSQGCNGLIKQGAKLVANINDIYDEIDFRIAKDSSQTNTESKIDKALELNKEQQSVLNIIARELTTLDEIILKSKFSYPKVTEILFELELKSLIESIPGGYINISIV